jgi:Membrane protein involved in the export of O-antigen and teichoic acid
MCDPARPEQGHRSFRTHLSGKNDHQRMFGTIVMAIGATSGLGLALVLLVFGFQSVLTNSAVNDPLSVGLLLILITLSPMQALDNLFQNLMAVFAKPHAIFFRRCILGPCLKLAAVVLVIATHSNVYVLAACYLTVGILGVSLCGLMLYQVLQRQNLLSCVSLSALHMPVREIFKFSIPLFTTDFTLVLRITLVVMLLEHFRGTGEVAAFSAVIHIANLNSVVMESFRFLFIPEISRLFAKKDHSGINNMYWQSAIWITLVSFPVFAVCFSLAEPVTVLVFGDRYVQSGIILMLLSVGYYFNAATAFNTYTLEVYGKIRFIVLANVLAAIIGLALSLWLIPLYGAIGAAIATSSIFIAHNLLNHAGLWLGTGLVLFQWRYLKVYLSIVVATLGLLLVQRVVNSSLITSMVFISLASLLLMRMHKDVLGIQHMFPELSRVPLLQWLLGWDKNNVFEVKK